MEEAEQEAKKHLGRAIDKLQDADRPLVLSEVENAYQSL
jgi:hypothetical protein